MKDDTSTPIGDSGASPNEFESDKPGTSARTRSETGIEKLRAEGGVFVDAVRATRMPMVLTDPNLPGNPVVFANEAFLKLSGYSMEDVLGQQPHFMNGPDTDPKDAARFREMIRCEQDELLETVQYRKNGQRFVATVLLSAFKDDAGRTLHHFMSWLDVTRRVDAEEERDDLRRAQAALRKTEAKFRALFDNMNEGFALTRIVRDEAGRAVDLIYLEMNDGVERQTGIARDAFIGRRLSEVSTNADFERWMAVHAQVAESGEQVTVEDYAESTNRWYEFSVYPSGKDELSIFVRDIDDRKRNEMALRESEQRLAAAFQSVPAGVAVIGKDGRVITANAQYRAFLPSGIIPSRDKIRGNLWQAWDNEGNPLPPEEWPGARALRGESVIPGQEMLYTEDDGIRRWTNVATAPTRDGSGAVTGCVSVITDITVRKHHEESLRRSDRHQKMLLAELQHRVRNTMAVVRSIARRTAERSPDVETMLSHFEGRLSAFSRVQSVVTRSPDSGIGLQSLIAEELLAVAGIDRSALRMKGPEILLRSRAAERMSLAIHELATNAVKYGALSAAHGQIEVEWRRTTRDGEDRLAFEWVETGLDEAPDSTREGFGHELLLRSLPYDLEAETGIRFTNDGICFTMTLPLKSEAIVEVAEG